MLSKAKQHKWSDTLNKLMTLLEYPLVFLLILTSNSVYFKSADFPGFRILQFSFLVNLFLISILSLGYLLINQQSTKKMFKFISVYTVLFLLFCFLSNRVYPLHKNLTLILLLIPILSIVYFYYCSINKKMMRVLVKLENTIIVLAALSLILWLIGPVFNIIHSTNYIAIKWGGTHGITSFYNLFFAAQGQVDFLGFTITRNTGIFVEAPIYAFVLILALLTNIFLDKKSWVKFTLLLLTILSTTSTTGVIVAIIAIGVKLLSNKRVYSVIPKKVRFYIAALLGIVICICAFLLIHKKVGSVSYSSRTDDFYAGFKAWLQHPLVGNGVGNYKSIMQHMDPSRLLPNGNSGFSSGFMKSLAEGGISLISFYVVPILLIINKYWNRQLNLVIFSLLLFSVFVITIINDIYLFIFMVTWLWASSLFSKDKIFS